MKKRESPYPADWTPSYLRITAGLMFLCGALWTSLCALGVQTGQELFPVIVVGLAGLWGIGEGFNRVEEAKLREAEKVQNEDPNNRKF